MKCKLICYLAEVDGNGFIHCDFTANKITFAKTMVDLQLVEMSYTVKQNMQVVSN